MSASRTACVPCLRCGRALESVWRDDDAKASGNQPYDATAFVTHGHEGSMSFDPMSGHYLEINVCTACLEAARLMGAVLLGRDGRMGDEGELVSIPWRERAPLVVWDGTDPDLPADERVKKDAYIRKVMSDEPIHATDPLHRSTVSGTNEDLMIQPNQSTASRGSSDYFHLRISERSGAPSVAACGLEWSGTLHGTTDLSRVTCERCRAFVLARTCTRATDHRTFDPKDGPVMVSIVYFKPSGKWYCEDESVLWQPDPNHYTKWAPFETLHRIRGMFAVCMGTPLGFPVSSPPTEEAWREATQ